MAKRKSEAVRLRLPILDTGSATQAGKFDEVFREVKAKVEMAASRRADLQIPAESIENFRDFLCHIEALLALLPPPA